MNENEMDLISNLILTTIFSAIAIIAIMLNYGFSFELLCTIFALFFGILYIHDYYKIYSNKKNKIIEAKDLNDAPK